MNPPSLVQRHPAVRWLVPLGVACAAVLAATGVFRAGASSESLPETTPAALIAAVQRNHVAGFSGTVVSNLSLGLPELPGLSTTEQDTSFASLLSGSHTMQVWYGGLTKQRVALLGPTDETDLFRNGRDVWQWSSATGVAVHTRLPAGGGDQVARPGPEALTPSGLAQRALAAVDPGTVVRVERDDNVADRSAYELILTPRSAATKIGSVHIAVDGATKVPLGVQIYPKGSSTAAVDVAFTSIRFAAPSQRNFDFTPPPNAHVRDLTRASGPTGASGAARAETATVTGSGWAAVVRLDPGSAAIASSGGKALLGRLATVAGPWGKGRLLDTPLLTVLFTQDGRIFAGAVPPEDLFAAARQK